MHIFLQQLNELNELQRELVSLHPFLQSITLLL